MNLIHLLRMARLVRRPPSAAQVKLVLGVIALVAAIALAERIWGFPDWLTPELTPRGRIVM